ncbi:alkaline shock response membrane anchor protein AmaP [Streptomyces sp. NPDC052042]|uniref:alkaline shock response membrane anchor protein AmaP n=1 Tax=Streptomyces sp. NPDC052042 TaxID=3365683 RepID=UPI0037CEE262
MNRLLRTVNRVLLGLAGLVLICGGGAALAAGLDLSVPSWWPWNGGNDVLLGAAGRDRLRDVGRWWPAVIATLAVVVVLALWWLLAQARRTRLAEVLVDCGEGEGALVRGRALEEALADEAAALDGVARAHVVLTGRREAPRAAVRLVMEPHAAPDEALDRLAEKTLARARDSAGLAALPAEVRLGAVGHPAERVG